MLRVIASTSPLVSETFVRVLALEQKEDTPIARVYRKGQWILLDFHIPFSVDTLHWIASTFLPERLYFPYLGYSIDMMHEVGDVIVPNVFFSYDTSLASADIVDEERDLLVKDPRFLEIFPEQKDYYVEDFGLSVGGILVDTAPKNPSEDLTRNMMLAYEGDVYIEESVQAVYDSVVADEVPSVILTGVILGKKHVKYEKIDPIEFSVKNIVTTIGLLEEE